MRFINVSLVITLVVHSSKSFPNGFFARPTKLTCSRLVLPMARSNKPDKPPSDNHQDKNWIDRVMPLDLENDKEGAIRRVADVEEYNVGISGISFQTGSLSAKMFDAMTSRQDADLMTKDMIRSYKLYAMDFTAKEATKLALKQNGFEAVIDDEDMGEWAEVDSIQFLNTGGQPVGQVYNSWEDAVDNWTPGQAFDFCARGIEAKLSELVLDDVLDALDPDGSLRKQAQERGISLPTEDLETLTDLANEVRRRCEEAPRGASTEDQVYKGDERRGYAAITASSLQMCRGENQKTIMHVMDALVSHGCLIVDLTDNGNDFCLAIKMANMWKTIDTFFSSLNEETEKKLPRMAAIEASPFAKMGYANFQNGMKFLETRLDRETGALLPEQVSDIVGRDGMSSLKEAFQIIANVGKNVVRIVTAVSSVENQGFSSTTASLAPEISGLSFLDRGEDDSAEGATSQAFTCATLMTDELVDDGTQLSGNIQQGPVSMSPHRLCQYSNPKEDIPEETFGAHTDSSFATLVPVAAVSGLEVFDEDVMQWYRPELKAREIWRREQVERGKDPEAFHETVLGEEGEEIQLPWHARYLVVMPGEFLQVVTRNEIAASVHRVVAAGTARCSAPVLLRGRPGTPMTVSRYLGEINNPLLQAVNGMSMQEIHDAMQPSFQ